MNKKDQVQMTKRQEEFLMEGLHSLRKSKYDWPKREYTEKEKQTVTIATEWAAKKAAIDREIDKEQEKEIKSWEKQLANFRKIILFGDPQKAMAELERLQSEA